MEEKNDASSRRRDNSHSVYFSKEVKERFEELAEKVPHGGSKSRLIEALVQYALDDIAEAQNKPYRIQQYLLGRGQEKT